jgi:poly-gamma-glutamate capsule biosynthesis protein CapA/YwtB (metallophosphatase superfamily)
MLPVEERRPQPSGDMRRTPLLALVLALASIVACRGPSTELPAGRVTLALSGDTNGYNIAVNPSLEGSDLLEGVSEVLADADVFVFNYEGTLIDPSDAPQHCRTSEIQSTFVSPPSFARRLAVRPQVVATLANNHAMDCGPEGLAQTRKAFEEAGVLTVGAGSNLAEACQPAEVTVNGVDVSLFAYFLPDVSGQLQEVVATEETPGVATMDGCGAEAAVRAAAAQKAVVVSLHSHAGQSWTYNTAPEHLSAVRHLLEWGADVVVSHGPHFPQGVVADAGGVGFLSLGNFLFRPDYTMPPEAHQSLLAVVAMADSRVVESRLYPLELTSDGLPVLARGQTSRQILELVSGLSQEHGGVISLQDSFADVQMGGP